MYCIYEILYYNNVTQCYINILILDRAPNSNDPLNQITQRIHFPKLSPFDVYSKCNENAKTSNTCGIVLLNQNNNIATIQDLPEIFTWLNQNNYKINTELTHIMENKQSTATKKFICYITKK